MPGQPTQSIPFSVTSLEGTTGAPIPSTFVTTGSESDVTVAAVLTEASTTITAFQVANTRGLAVVDGTTLSHRHESITLADGNVVSLLHNGLADESTTAHYQVITVTNGTDTKTSTRTTPSTSTRKTIVGTTTESLTSVEGTHRTSRIASPTSEGSSTSRSITAASSSSSGAAPTLGAVKTVALLGALGGMIAYGI